VSGEPRQEGATRPPTRGRLDLLGLRRAAGRLLLPAWFAIISFQAAVATVGNQGFDPLDARLYVAATRAWLAGQDPWSVAYHGIYFAAPPPTLLAMLPFAVLPDPAGWIALALLSVIAGVATIRMLGLPWWWLLFPPLVLGAISGNPQLLLVPLLLGGGGWLAGLAKVYAIVPAVVLGRRRQVGAFAVVVLATAPFLPWAQYLGELGAINARLAEQSRYGFSTTVAVALAVPALVGFWLVGRERTAWLAVPALWPMQQWYYGTLALPARSALACAIIAAPIPASGTLAVLVVGAVEAVRRITARRRM
jgi:hypothetical protein